MSAKKHHTKAGVVYRQRAMPPLMRAVAAALGCLFLAAPFAEARDTALLIRQNKISAPFSYSCPKDQLVKATQKPAAAARVTVKNSVPVKKTAMELALQEKTDEAVVEQMERTPVREPSPALVEAIMGGHATSPHTKVKIGYGKMVVDNSNTVGMKNGTRLEEPGCLYVKTSVNF